MEITGYYPGAIGRITELHATYYNDNWDLDVTFETQVGRELSEFIDHFHPERDGLWIAKISGTFAGSVAIGGSETERDARLRWFIVAPEYQGRGIGKVLLRNAIFFCREKKFGEIYLWTFEGLERNRSDGTDVQIEAGGIIVAWILFDGLQTKHFSMAFSKDFPQPFF
jgi:GNAT superfamily N-acetyltransferase